MPNQSITKQLAQTADLINQKMAEILLAINPQNLPNQPKPQLLEAALYSTSCGGKRIRPFLLIATNQMLNSFKQEKQNLSKNIGENPKRNKEISQSTLLEIACALEFIHIYSLIHDDLPAMDNDDFRRGKPTCHKQFSEATAILAGDALLTFAFEVLSSPKLALPAKKQSQIIHIITKAIGFNGMAGGQMLDLQAKSQPTKAKQILAMHHLKTGKLIISAVEIALVLSGVNRKYQKNLLNFATNIGTAFQIKDDILDFMEHLAAINQTKPEQAKISKENLENNPKENSTIPNQNFKENLKEEPEKKPKEKPKEKLIQNHKKNLRQNFDQTNIVHFLGLKKANLKLENLAKKALSNLAIFGENGKNLTNLTNFIVGRDF